MRGRVRLTTILRLLLLLSVAGSCFGFGRGPLDVALPEVPAPNGASWHWVSKHMAYNGLPMSIKMFEYAGTEEEVESFYRNYWRMEGHGQSSVKDFRVYKIMSYDLRGFYTTVQYRFENGFVKGKIVVTESPGKRLPDKKSELPVPPGGTIASKVQTRDNGKLSETLTIESHKRIEFNKGYYESQLDYLDWKLVYESDNGRASVVQHYQKGSELLQINIKKLTGIDNNRTQILVHWIK